MGLNIGKEIYGKGADFTRPVLILKKLSKDKFIGIPLTTSFNDSPYYFPLNVKNRHGALCFNEIRVFSAKRLKDKIEKINDNIFKKIKEKIAQFISA